MASLVATHVGFLLGALALITLFSVGGSAFVVYRAFRPQPDNRRLLSAMWWGIEAVFMALVVALSVGYLTIGEGDRFANGLAFYLLAIWSSPAIVCGVICLLAKPKPIVADSDR